MPGFRKHGRTLVKCAVRLTHRDIGDVVTETRDISETGVFVTCRDLVHFISIGDEFDATLYSDTDHVSETQLKVVRLTTEGVGLAFA
ncbi:PilZ domain-containing protein [Teredinibacter waterburyi]|jgi:PilZ domain.|uniref:PilZ domain-containing protein n=1 Tax=Teredinibacter waterburyi TaxID=1500538 RepID=UPI00165F7140|nr:PilZ domain-containing protein [Teredinibacter waterburyi]